MHATVCQQWTEIMSAAPSEPLSAGEVCSLLMTAAARPAPLIHVLHLVQHSSFPDVSIGSWALLAALAPDACQVAPCILHMGTQTWRCCLSEIPFCWLDPSDNATHMGCHCNCQRGMLAASQAVLRSE